MKRQLKVGSYFQAVKRPEKDYESSSGESDGEIDPLDDDTDNEGELSEPSSSSLQTMTRKPESTACINECCQSQVEASTPYQPSDKATISTTQQKSGQKFRSLNPKWYKDFKWLHFCVVRKKVFCHYCLQCYNKGLLTMTKKYEDAFILNGFENWKKARERFERHQVSECHREA